MGATAFLAMAPFGNLAAQSDRPDVLLGGPVEENTDPDKWIRELKRKGYWAAHCPVEDSHMSDADIKLYETAAKRAGITIAEVGAWSNPISPDESSRLKAQTYCQEQLALADRIGANCCVNIAGGRGEVWDGPHPNNLTRDTFDLIVETTRTIIDAVKPTRTYFTLETMPWIFPNSVDSYVDLIAAIDRDRFAVHLDPANLVNSPERYFRTGDLIRDAFAKLGPQVRSCHGKDVLMIDGFPVNIQEVRPGLGILDYKSYLSELSKLPEKPPLMLEHSGTDKEYHQAATYVRSVARDLRLTI